MTSGPKNPETSCVLPLGLNGFVVRFGLSAGVDMTGAVRAFTADLEGDPIAGVTQVAGSLASVYIEYSGDMAVRGQLVDALQQRLQDRDWTEVAAPLPRRRWRIPVCFAPAFGPQFREACAAASVDEVAAIAEICARDIDVLSFGFAPGQAYLGFLPERWNLPRLEAVTPRVPEGALILAIRQLILFTNPNPTGWRHIAQTGFISFDHERQNSFLLREGDVLRFASVSDTEMQAILADNPDKSGQARLEILQ